jgi:hypothetical protein
MTTVTSVIGRGLPPSANSDRSHGIPLPRIARRDFHRLIRNTCGECSEGAGAHPPTPTVEPHLGDNVHVWPVFQHGI